MRYKPPLLPILRAVTEDATAREPFAGDFVKDSWVPSDNWNRWGRVTDFAELGRFVDAQDAI